MRVLFLTHRLPYAPNRGDRIRAYYLMQEMSRFAAISLFSLVHDDEEASQVARVPFADRVTTVRVKRGRNLVRAGLALASSAPLTHVLLDAADARAALMGLTRSAPPDLVVAYCSSMARFALAPPLNGWPLVLDMVDVDSAKWAQLGAEVSGPLGWIYRREAARLRCFEIHAVQRAAMTLTVNDREADRLREIAPTARITIVANGIDIDAFGSRGAPEIAPVVIFCGVMTYYPNEEGVRWFVQDVWPTVRSRNPGARFIVVGAGARHRLRRLVARDASIELVGAVAEVQPYLWRSAVSVAPLRLARGLQNKVLEALAAALPVVVTPSVWAGLPTEAQPGCVVANTADEFAAAVVRLLDDSPAERRHKASAARLDRLTWSEQFCGLETIFNNALTNP